MLNKLVAKAAKKLGLRLIVNEPGRSAEPADEVTARQFADLLERKYNEANRNSIGGMRFSNVVDVFDFPEDLAIVALAMNILSQREFDTELHDYSNGLGRHLSVRMSPRNPHG